MDCDRNDLPVRTVICRWCGLLYISPRMTKEWYDRYYQEEYRQQMARLRGGKPQLPDFQKMFHESFVSNKAFFEHMRHYLGGPGLTIDVGSGVGGALAAIREVVDGSIFGIEPSAAEASYANACGIRTEAVLFENFKGGVGSAARVMSLRNLNHLLDPKRFLCWAWDILRPDGRLILMVQNFRLSVKKLGSLKQAIQIDHVYMFTPEVLRAFVHAAGFDIVYTLDGEMMSMKELANLKTRALGGGRTVLVAVRSDRKPFAASMEIPRQYRQVKRSLSYPVIFRFHILWRLYQKYAVKRI